MSCNMTGYVRHPQYRTNRKCCEDSKWRSWKIHLVAKRSSSNYPTEHFFSNGFFPWLHTFAPVSRNLFFAHWQFGDLPSLSIRSRNMNQLFLYLVVTYNDTASNMRNEAPGCQDGGENIWARHPKKVSVNSVNFEFINFLVGGDWNHGIFHDFPWKVGKFHPSQLANSIIFHRGRYTTNQLWLFDF